MELGNGRYTIRRKLGAGGMGVVYEAVDGERKALVALKTLRQANPAAITRLKREFRSLADVIHPNLVALYELHADAEEIFFTMELVAGAAFSRWVRPPAGGPDGSVEADAPASESLSLEEVTRQLRGPHGGESDGQTGPTLHMPVRPARQAPPPLDVRRLRLGLRQLAEGVAAIHEHGLLHRDLKPSNVLVTAAGRLVILDFGLVTDLGEEALATSDDRPLEGTALFMSPEQAARTPLSPASDWYAVGVMLYQALTGQVPFAGGRDQVLMDKQRFEPPPPGQIAASVPADLDALCTELLRRDPRARPDGAEILRRVGSDVTGPHPAAAPASSHGSYDLLVGRARQLGELGQALAAARQGQSLLVHVHGPSGMGKSRLTRAFLEQATAEGGTLVLHARCYERESVPFKAVDGLVDALARHLASLPPLEVEGLTPRDAPSLARIFPVLKQIESFTSPRRRAAGAGSGQELRRRAFAALRELLGRLADRQPLVLAVDDVQWADVDSAALLSALLVPPDPPPLLLVAAYRSEDAAGSEFVRALAAATAEGVDVRHVEVGPLDAAEARELALLHLERALISPAALDHIVQESQGNPYFVEELARHVKEHVDAGAAAPTSLRDLLRARFCRLPAPAARLLAAVAVAGRPLPQELAMRAAEVTDPAALSLLKAGSFLRGRGIGGLRHVEVYHDRIREETLATLDDAALRDHHRRLAALYEATPSPDAETLTMHLRGAGDLVRAAEFAALGGARAAQALAFDRAARLYRLALELDPTANPRALRLALGDALANAGRGVEAADAYQAAAEGAPQAEAIELTCRAAGHLLRSGHFDRGLALLERTVEQIGMRVGKTARESITSLLLGRARIALRGLGYTERDEQEVPARQLLQVDTLWSAAEGLGFGDTLTAADFHTRHLRLALKVGEPRRVARALFAETVFRSLGGTRSRARAEALLGRCLALTARYPDDQALKARAALAHAFLAFNQGRWKDAATHATRCEQIVRDSPHAMRWELATAQNLILGALVLSDGLREAMRRLPIVLKEANERGDLYTSVSALTMIGFHVGLARDDPQAARRDLEGALARWSTRGFHLQHVNGLASLMTIDLYAGEPARALERCRVAWPAAKRAGVLRIQIVSSLLLGGRGKAELAAVEAGDRARLADLARTAAALERERVGHAQAQALTLRAGLAYHLGDRAGALDLLARCDAAFAAEHMTMNGLAVRLVRGALLGGSEGAALVAEAEAFFRAAGVKHPARLAWTFAPVGPRP